LKVHSCLGSAYFFGLDGTIDDELLPALHWGFFVGSGFGTGFDWRLKWLRNLISFHGFVIVDRVSWPIYYFGGALIKYKLAAWNDQSVNSALQGLEDLKLTIN